MAISVPPSDGVEFLPLFPDETEEAILARMAETANEGLDPTDDADLWVDTREGGHWATGVTSCARELARFYDRAGTEVPMSAMVVWSWGAYLDDLADAWSVRRLAATAAMGRVLFEGAEGTPIGAGTVVSVSPSDPEDPAPSFEVTEGGTIGESGRLELSVRCTNAGAEGNVGAGAITAPQTPLPGVTLSNPEATVGGSDPETDEALSVRLIEALEGHGPGTSRDYRIWAGEHDDVGHVTVIPVWEGAGTVLVIITDPDGQPNSEETVLEVQAELDPTPGEGAGKAPIGAIVTVSTARLLDVDVAARLDFEAGYGLDAEAGTIAVRAQIEAAVAGYVAAVRPGGEVVRSQVLARIVGVPGVHDAGDVVINGSEANLRVASAPAEVPTLHELRLTEGTP